MQQQSQDLHNLMAMSDELIVLMTHVTSMVNKLVSAHPPKLALVLLPHPMVMTNSAITLIPAPVPELTTLPFPSTQ